ncbi:C40 family peptidase [Vibrio algarum]|uniref:NlpC/P60 family protein n=1 Tax=Vibrio algarum TaxID=3020714 RepID=A0ABT4YRA0_9VIBR|nr:NlpC/P60 family protein [Vibrio sp. KJ40-1]MDB1123932.1 NlpC/P60 family protein [Vibrio sp. KJ40-1]
MYYKPRAIIILISAFLFSACSSHKQSNAPSTLANSAQSIFIKESNSIYKQPFDTWQGTPYKYGGDSKNGVDCSAFVQRIYLETENRYLPRTTYEQSKLGTKIKLSQAKSGDLVFFKTTHKDRHVGIYLDDQHFMHASTSKGVIISRLNNPYWASVFWQVRRVN